MSLHRFHQFVLTAVPFVAAMGLWSGDLGLASAAVAFQVLLLLASGQFLRSSRPRWRTLGIHGLTVVILVACIASFRHARFDVSLIVIMLGVANRFWLRTGPRDDVLILGACVVLLSAVTVVTPGVAFLGIFLVCFPLTLWGLWSSTLLGLTLQSDRASVGLRLPKGRLQMALTGLLFAGFIAAGASFLPRHPFARAFRPGGLVALPGADNHMELSNGGGETLADNTVVLRIRPLDVDGSEPDGLYVRFFSLDQFDGRSWNESVEQVRVPLKAESSPLIRAERRLHVTLDRGAFRMAPQVVPAVGRQWPAFVEGQPIDVILSGTWNGRTSRRGMQDEFLVALNRRGVTDGLSGRWLDEQRSRALHLPDSIDPRIPRLAAELTQGSERIEDKVNAITGYFDQGYRYSTEPNEGDVSDPLARFLFEAKAGHCELYAGALAVLLRSAGVPARVATGYYGGWWNRLGGYLEITQEDAHAWVEVQMDGRWSWVDATPPAARIRRTGGTFSWLRDLHGAMEAFWFTHVLDFDEQRRQQIIDMAKERFFPEGAASGDWEGWLTSRTQDDADSVPRFLWSFIPLGLMIGFVAIWRRRRRSAADRLGYRLRKALGHGRPPDAHTTARALFERLSVEQKSLAHGCILTYERYRYGPRDEAPEIEQLALQVRSLEQAMARDRVKSRRSP
jgi:transglutaminase-like putative cysteine protease